MIRSSLENAGGKVQNRLPFANRGSQRTAENTLEIYVQRMMPCRLMQRFMVTAKKAFSLNFSKRVELTELFFLLAPNIRERILQRNQLECAVLAFGVCANQISKYHP